MTPAKSEALNQSIRHDPHSERRKADRMLTVYRIVQVEREGEEGLGCCRNISDSGAKLHLTMPVALNDCIEVAFSPTIALTGRVIWIRDNECGVAFDRKIDCAALLSHSFAETHGYRARAPRLKANVHATICYDGRTKRTMINDISQHGMKVTHDGTIHPGLILKVVLECGRERDAEVRWTKDNFAGLFFPEPFSVDDLGSIRSL
jgi:hypothetical protein